MLAAPVFANPTRLDREPRNRRPLMSPDFHDEGAQTQPSAAYLAHDQAHIKKIKKAKQKPAVIHRKDNRSEEFRLAKTLQQPSHAPHKTINYIQRTLLELTNAVEALEEEFHRTQAELERTQSELQKTEADLEKSMHTKE